MKLTGIAIDGYRTLSNIRLMQISPSMNMVYGEKGSGKTRIAEFIGGIFFGKTNELRHSGHHNVSGAPDPVHGNLEVSNSRGRFTLTRDVHAGNRLNVTSATQGVAPSADLQNQVTGSLDADLYQTFFNISFATRTSAHSSPSNPTLANALHRRLGVGIGPDYGGDTSANAHNIQTANSLNFEIESVNGRIASLQHRSQQLKSQIANNTSSTTTRANQLDSQISEIERRIVTLTTNPHGQELSVITAEIDDLHRRIGNAQTTYVAPAAAPVNNGSLLYEQLDEIDMQIGRWRSVQNDVQVQRVQLKDEMVLWNEMTLESEHHPYHNARAILLNLEKRVDHAESQTAQWLDSHGPVDSHQAAGFVNDVCKGMRSDLYDLCDELGKQYKQIRHRAAAAELKRLRRCYEEITENVTRLIQRKKTVIEQIRISDPAGAEAILRGDEKFCQCAAHEGHLKARERFLGPVTAAAPVPQMVPPNLTQERSRLSVLENRRAELQRNGSTNSLEMTQLRSQIMNLRNERNSLSSVDDSQWRIELTQAESELQSQLASLRTLNLKLDEASKVQSVTPHPLLIEASQILTRLSHGELSRVWLTGTSDQTDLQVQDRHQRVLHLSALSATMKTQTELSLILAANQRLAAEGMAAPLIIDELFGDFDGDRIDTALQYLTEFSARGHQVILLTQHRFLVDRANNFGTIKFFDIESQATHVHTSAPAAFVQTPVPPVIHTPAPATISFSSAKTFAAPPVNRYPAPVAEPISAVVKPVILPKPVEPKVNHFQTVAPQTVTSIKANQIGDRLECAVTYEEHSQLADIAIFDSLQLRTLNESGIHSIADLLDVDVERLPSQWSEAGLTRSVIENMQSEIWLLTCVPALRTYDAHVLVACGIYEPDQLETSAAQMLLERVQRYLNAHETEHDLDDSYRITLSRIGDWHKGIAKTRNRWRNRREGRNRSGTSNRSGISNRSVASKGFQRRSDNGHVADNRTSVESQSRGPRIRRYRDEHDNRADQEDRIHRNGRDSNNGYSQSNSRTRSERRYDDRDSDRAQNIIRADRSFSRQRDSRERDSRERDYRERDYRERDSRERESTRTPRMTTPTPETVRRSVPALAPESTRTKETKPAATRNSTSSTSSQSSKSTQPKLKFYLDLEDHIEAAPSIGPKTAERFEKIGVFTIADFLKQTADSMATKLNYKRMSVDVVRSWQHQARLVCRIPNLRGHDAQLLVACEFLEPEEIASMQPQALFGVIGPFSETKEGLKIIRSGKKPDLAEITDWIEWAQHTRSLQAA